MVFSILSKHTSLWNYIGLYYTFMSQHFITNIVLEPMRIASSGCIVWSFTASSAVCIQHRRRFERGPDDPCETAELHRFLVISKKWVLLIK